MQQAFESHEPVDLYVENQAGDITVTSADTTETVVTATGDRAEEVSIEQSGNRIAVLGPRPKTGFFRSEREIAIEVRLPHDSTLTLRTGSGDVAGRGRFADVEVKVGSGDCTLEEMTGSCAVDSGSGDVTLDRVAGEARLRSGSGDLGIETLGGTGVISTGSGDLRLGETRAPLSAKTGSGDVEIGRAGDDLTVTTGSGSVRIRRIERGRVAYKTASGDLEVGIPKGVPVWTDVSSISGDVRLDLEGSGEPAPGQDHIELRAVSVSGDVVLREAG